MISLYNLFAFSNLQNQYYNILIAYILSFSKGEKPVDLRGFSLITVNAAS